jgi:hypothetical protein
MLPQHELTFANHVHQFDASQGGLRCLKRLETQHRPGERFDRAMVLLHDIVEVVDLPDRDRNFPFRIQLLKCRLVGAALVHRHRVGGIGVPHRFLEEALGC